jgi:hypothetical protein
MRKIREVFRLKFDSDISNRQIAMSCNIARSTVGEYLFRFQQAALSWPLPQDIDDNQLEQLLYPQLPAVPADQRPVPDWSYIHQQLRHKSVTLMLLWQEHKEQYPQGYFQRTIVRYTEFDHMTDRGLCPVLRTRPGLAPPQICLPSTFRYGAYLYVDPRFCLRLPSSAHYCTTLAFSYPSPPSGWVWTLPDTRVIISDITI